jgi:hypothetical protein
MTKTYTLFRQEAPKLMRRYLEDFPELGVLDVAAIVGNFGGETGGFKFLQEKRPVVRGSRGGWGLAQWTGPRRRAFEAFCKKHGYELSSFNAMYLFSVEEMRGPEKRAIPALRRAKTLEDKTIAFERAYERAGVKHYPTRIRYAKLAVAAYKASGGDIPEPAPAKPAKPAPKPRPKPRPKPVAKPVAKPLPVEVDDATFGVKLMRKSKTVWLSVSGFFVSGFTWFAALEAAHQVMLVGLIVVAALFAALLWNRFRDNDQAKARAAEVLDALHSGVTE